MAARVAGVWGGGRVRLGYYLRLVTAQWRMSVLAALQYRLGFWTEGLLGVVWSAIGIAPLLVATWHLDAVAGWTTPELLVLTGCFTIVSGLFGALLQPALLESMQHIRRGTLDYVLLRPADALFLCLTTSFSPWTLIETFAGVLLIVGALIHRGVAVAWSDLATATALGVAGLAALVALGILVLCASFRALQLQNLTYLMESVLDFSRWPAQVFRGFLRIVFTFVIPLAIMTTYPAEALLGRADRSHVLTAVVVAGGLLALARLVWLRAIRGYTSASS